MRIGNHLGTSFGVWNGRHAWFWFVADARCQGAAIGAATNEAEAICEAHSSIEEIVARRPGIVESEGNIKAAVDGRRECAPEGSRGKGQALAEKYCLVTEG